MNALAVLFGRKEKRGCMKATFKIGDLVFYVADEQRVGTISQLPYSPTSREYVVHWEGTDIESYVPAGSLVRVVAS
jgi:hypothetical protein